MRHITRILLLTMLVAAGILVASAPEVEEPAAAQTSCQQPWYPTEGFWIAAPDSAPRERLIAAAEGHLTDGTNDEVQWQEAIADAACATASNRKVNVAPGNYTVDFRYSGISDGNGPINVAIMPPVGGGGPSQSDPVRVIAANPWTVVHSKVAPAAVGTNCGFNNRLMWFRQANIRLEGFTIDGHAFQQIGGSNRNDQRFQMEGIRENNSNGFYAKSLTIQNIRGVTGEGGCGETTFLNLDDGDADNVTVQVSDGGDGATGFGQINGGPSVISNSRAFGNGHMAHGFGQWRADNPIRWNVTATGMLGAGVRSEISANPHDLDVHVDNNAQGWVTFCSTNHVLDRLDADNNGAWGLGLVSNTPGTRINGGHSLGTGQYDVFLFQHTVCPGGVTFSDYTPDGTFTNFTYVTRGANFSPNWASYGL